jgi:ketosteroid isomerase-like protein
MARILILIVCSLVLLPAMGWSMRSDAVEMSDPESAIRALVRANADKDMTTLSRLIAHDADIISYTIDGRKYVGWPDLERDFHEEFSAVERLELPIRELNVWSKGDVAWFTMELDYIRFFHENQALRKIVMQLRETGVLERRAGEWVLLSWHESQRTMPLMASLGHQAGGSAGHHLVSTSSEGSAPDLSGEWDILEVDNDKHYKATLDKAGNGPYTQHGGRFVTTKVADRLWQGTWQQPGNDREGGFELLLSEDGMQAKGIWWYTRVGKQKNIPAREHGGTYQWKRLTSPTTAP